MGYFDGRRVFLAGGSEGIGRSTAVELARFAQALLEGGGGALSPAAVRALLAPQTAGLNERRGLGWCLYDPRRPPAGAGDLWTERAFGHTGFTGVSLWADPAPERRLIVVLLTTWVGGGAELAALRARVHNAVVGSLKA